MNDAVALGFRHLKLERWWLCVGAKVLDGGSEINFIEADSGPSFNLVSACSATISFLLNITIVFTHHRVQYLYQSPSQD